MDKQTTLDLFEPQQETLDQIAKLEEESHFELTQNLEQQVLLEEELEVPTEEVWNLTSTFESHGLNDDFTELKFDNLSAFEDIEDFKKQDEELQIKTDETINEEPHITQDLVIEESLDETAEIEINDFEEVEHVPGMTSAFANLNVIGEKKVEEIRVAVEENISKVGNDDFGKVNIVVIGVGSCGCNAINRMFQDKNDNIKLVAVDTSEQTLEAISADHKILIGENEFQGHGSGRNVALVEKAFDDAKGKFQSLLDNVDMLFLAGGLGRGTGSVGLHRIGEIARDMGILTIGFATIPSAREGNGAICTEYYPKFINSVDSTILVENDKIAEVARDLPIKKAMEIADSMLVDGIRGIYELITKPGKINLDYADIKTAFKNQGTAVMGLGYGTGENAVVTAISDAIHSEIIELENVKKASNIIFNITCGKECVTISDATRGTDLIYSLESDGNIQQLFFGYSFDETLVDKVKVTFIATGTHQENIDFNKKPRTSSFRSMKSPAANQSPSISFSKPENLTTQSSREVLLYPD